ncbi:GIP [Symbiodinium sp. CCMP2456]|nr:GIP [Symbiodinium sp. CCMP2456]
MPVVRREQTAALSIIGMLSQLVTGHSGVEHETAATGPGNPAPGNAVSHQQIKSMLADAAVILQQAMPSQDRPVIQATPISPPAVSPSSLGPANTTSGQGTGTSSTGGTPATLASLSAQIEGLKAMARDHEVKALSVTSLQRVEEAEGDRALLDSGATHAVIPYSEGLRDLQTVPVTLAGEARAVWLRTKGGTLVETQALSLIRELEEARLKRFEEEVQDLECHLQALNAPVNPTVAVQRYITSGNRGDALRAIFAQPYLQGLPDEMTVPLAEELPGMSEDAGKRILKRLPLKRARRRALLALAGPFVFRS